MVSASSGRGTDTRSRARSLSFEQTGIRDRDTIRNIEQTFVGPMRAAVARWLAALGGEFPPPPTPARPVSFQIVCGGLTRRAAGILRGTDELHAVMPLAALQTNIERVDAAVGALALAPAE